jgi:hypothetical protein
MKRKSEASVPEGRKTRSIAAEDGIGLRSKKGPKKVVDSEDSNGTAKSSKLSAQEQRIRAQEYAELHFPVKSKTPAKTPLKSKTSLKKVSVVSEVEPEIEIEEIIEIKVKPMTAKKPRKSIGKKEELVEAVVESSSGRGLRQRDSLG